VVSEESVKSQLIRIGFNTSGWTNKAEVRELPHILLPDEEIYECVNGYYEGGFALLVATNVRVLLVDKKPFNFLTVEDLRFDMINEIDYSHRLRTAYISISAGNKNLKFRSYNQARLRKLINHVQHCIAEIKKQQSQHQVGQNQHLEQINQQLQTYLLAQYQNQQDMSQRIREAQQKGAAVDVPVYETKPSPELADYLFAQSLLRQHAEQQSGQQQITSEANPETSPTNHQGHISNSELDELYDEGRREIFGRSNSNADQKVVSNDNNDTTPQPATSTGQTTSQYSQGYLEINPMRIACAKLPMAFRNRKFGRPSFHAHSQAAKYMQPIVSTTPQTAGPLP
jgi:Bacterial PH domain